MKIKAYILIVFTFLMFSCVQKKEKSKTSSTKTKKQVTAKDVLGNPNYLAISYGGYRQKTRDIQPTIEELKEDMKILNALGINILRTYNVKLPQAGNIAQAISELSKENPSFEMYMMLGAWIDCKNAWTGLPVDHNVESENNESEINRAVALANKYPDIIKIIAVGNEAMVKWATSYYVQPDVILKWVNHLQSLKKENKLPKDLWITSSDDYASWGGGSKEYHVKDLDKLIEAVDYVSMHTYPYHNTHYNPEFWGIDEEEEDNLSSEEKIEAAMKRALKFAQWQYTTVSQYVHAIDPDKTIHIGETGWATVSNGHYGANGSKATDEYKEALYHNYMRDWTNKAGISCFYFEAFNEPWKDSHNQKGSENHFGLFTEDGKAKYVFWDLVDKGVFKGLTRAGNPITKTYDGNKNEMMKYVELPPIKDSLAVGF